MASVESLELKREHAISPAARRPHPCRSPAVRSEHAPVDADCSGTVATASARGSASSTPRSRLRRAAVAIPRASPARPAFRTAPGASAHRSACDWSQPHRLLRDSARFADAATNATRQLEREPEHVAADDHERIAGGISQRDGGRGRGPFTRSAGTSRSRYPTRRTPAMGVMSQRAARPGGRHPGRGARHRGSSSIRRALPSLRATPLRHPRVTTKRFSTAHPTDLENRRLVPARHHRGLEFSHFPGDEKRRSNSSPAHARHDAENLRPENARGSGCAHSRKVQRQGDPASARTRPARGSRVVRREPRRSHAAVRRGESRRCRPSIRPRAARHRRRPGHPAVARYRECARARTRVLCSARRADRN